MHLKEEDHTIFFEIVSIEDSKLHLTLTYTSRGWRQRKTQVEKMMRGSRDTNINSLREVISIENPLS